MRHQQQVAHTAINELGPARDNCGHGHLSLINKIKAIYSFLIARIKVRYSPNHYLLLLLCICILLHCRDVKTTFSSSIRNVLSGVKLIDWLVQNEVGQNREQAMAFAQDLFGIKILRHSEWDHNICVCI